MFPNKWFNITVVQVYCPTTDVEEAEVDQFYEDLKQVLELTPKKKKRRRKKKQKRDVLFIVGDWNAKVGSQWIPRITGKFGPAIQNEANRVLSREYPGHRKHSFPTKKR